LTEKKAWEEGVKKMFETFWGARQGDLYRIQSFSQRYPVRTTLVFIPGLGADSRLFLHQQKVFKNSLAPPWLPPRKGESLARYARCWAKDLKLKPGCGLVGVSFGGMVAQEMAQWVSPKAVILIGSRNSPTAIPFHLKWAGSLPTWPRLSKSLCRIFPNTSGYFLGAKTPSQRDLLIRMFLETPDNFAKWTVEAIREWEGREPEGKGVHHIHGEKDHLIPLKRVKPDRVVRGGGHLINLTHPKEVNGFIWECLERIGTRK
jgi:pimeloyl-ACP methyl ester carboxylesterase